MLSAQPFVASRSRHAPEITYRVIVIPTRALAVYVSKASIRYWMHETNIDIVAKPTNSPPVSGTQKLTDGQAVHPSQKIPIGRNGAPIIDKTNRSSGGTRPSPDCLAEASLPLNRR